jgi:tetratricopeptide (TPR) repeat protein
MSRRWLISVILAVALPFTVDLAAQGVSREVPRSVLQQSAEEFQKGKVSAAEETLRGALKRAPDDPAALGLLGVVLDAQQRYEEAEKAYRQALAILPHSAALLNNLGNHYLAQGKEKEARAAFLKVVAEDPKHPNASLQLARLSVDAKQGATALRYLHRLPAEEQASPPVGILRARALKLTGQDAAADKLLAEVEQSAGSDPRIVFTIGMAYVEWGRFADGEQAFARALDADPANFDILYNLGLAAQHAGHLSRAVEVYQVALKQRPNNADCLFNLASIYTQTGHADEAVLPLMQAHKAAPERTDILLALAQTCADLGFYADAVTAINDYLKLKPQDDVARRERGFCLIRSISLDKGMEDLNWYVQKHPKDPRGLYELAIGETVRERDKALEHLNRAVALDPKFNAARYARAVLCYENGKTEESIADLKQVVATSPNDFRALDSLAQDYMRLQQWKEADELLARAYKLSPKDAKILTHYSRVLIRIGQKAQAEKLLADFRALGPEEARRRPYGGLFDFLSMTPEQQFAKYMLNLQRTITTHPDDPTLRMQLGRTLLRLGKTEEGLAAYRAVLKLTTRLDLLTSCANTLMDHGQYAAAREFLEPVVKAKPDDADLRLDLAISVFHSGKAQEALDVLSATPLDQRKGDYFLLLAQILDAMQKPDAAAQALNRGFAAAPTRPDLYFEAALFLVKHKQYHRAIKFLTKATQAIPNSPELLLTLAMVHQIVDEFDQTGRILTQIESRWPEWSLPYEVNGISLETRLRSAQALPELETAISLGAHDANVYYYLASALTHARPLDHDSAWKAIEQALKLNPDDVFVQSLAGKIAYERKDYPDALQHLQTALRLWPDMVEAHQALSAVYRALGEKDKSIAELKEIVRIKQANPTADQTPPLPTANLLFSVRPPTGPAM